MKKIFSVLLAAVLAAGTMVLPTAAADGDIVYLQTFDDVASYDDLGWEIVETLTTNTSTYTVENGALTVDNLGGNDSYTVVVPASVMDEVNTGDYTVGYDFTLLESGDTARYLAMLLNYDREVGNTYNSLHMRMKGYADWQNRFVGTWSTNMDLNGGYQGLPVFTAKDDGAVSNRLFGLAYDETQNVIAGQTIRYEMRVSNTDGYAEVYMNGVLISGTDEAGWDQFTWASEDYSEICLKSGGSILGTVDNIVVVKGLGIPEGTIPAMEGGASASGLPATEYDSIANYAGIKPVIDGKIDAIWDATAAQESTWPGDLNGEGISGYTKILWDEDNLYFLGVVNDATTLQEANPTTTDSIDFWVSETYSDELGYPLEGDYLLTLSPYNTVSGKGAEFVNETAAVINGDGTYILEFSIPWLTADLNPGEGTVIGFNASYNNDLDGDGVRDSWTSWVEWTNMPYWSDTMWLDQVELVKADVAVAVEETPAAEAAPAEGAIEYAHFVASGNDPYLAYENIFDFDPSVVTWAQIKYRTVTEKDSLDNTLTGQIYITPAAEPNIPVKWNHTGNWETIVVDLTSVSESTTLASLWADSLGLGFRFDPMESNRDAEANTGDDPAVVLPDSAIDIAYIAFFETEEAAAAYDGVNGTPAALVTAEDLTTGTGANNLTVEVLSEVPAAAEEPAAEEAAPAAEADEANLFTGATVVEVSGLEVEGSNTGDMAIDGDLATRWSSNVDDAAHIIVDLGAVTPVDSLDIYWETACAADYTVEVSEDNSNWTVVATVTGNTVGASPAGDAVSHEWDTVNARYIKINCTKRNTEWGNSIWELVAYAAEAPAAEEAVEAPAEEPVINEEVEAAEEAPAEEEVAETPAAAEAVEEAPQTFDFGVAAAIAAIVSLAGFAASKKR